MSLSWNRADLASAHFLGHSEFFPVVQPQLVGLLTAEQHLLGFQTAAGDAHPGQALVLVIVGNLEHARAEFRGRLQRLSPPLKPGKQVINALQFQPGAKVHRRDLARGNQLLNRDGRQLPRGRKLVQRRVVLQGDGLKLFLVQVGKRDAPVAERPLQLVQHLGLVRAGHVHFVYKNKRRHLVARQKPPQGPRVAGNAVGRGNHQHRVIEHRQHLLSGTGKIHVARGVQQR